MRTLRALLLYFIAVFIGGALFAPPLDWLIQSLAHHFPDAFNHGLGEKIATAPLHRYVNRCILLIALIGLWPLVKSLGFASMAEVGFVKPSGEMKKFGAGFLLGLISLAVIAGLSLACHARQMNTRVSADKVAERLLESAAAAIIIATLEELLFRGALYGALRKAFHWKFALVFSSAFYATMHFFDSAKDPTGPITWLSGLQILPPMFANLGNLHAAIPGVLNLTLAGMLLALAYQRTGNLYFSIGLHMGWIFWVKAYAIVTSVPPHTNKWIWGSGRMAIVNGWIALPILFATLLAFAWKTSNIERRTSNIE